MLDEREVHLYMKRNDTGEPFRAQILSRATGRPVDLTGASVKMLMFSVDVDGALTSKIDSAMTIEQPSTSGIVRYDWQPTDTDTNGEFLALVQATLGAQYNSVKESYPRKGYVHVHIENDLDDA